MVFKVIFLFLFTALVAELSTVAPSIPYTPYLQTGVLLTRFPAFLLPGSGGWQPGWAEEPDEVSAHPACVCLRVRVSQLGPGLKVCFPQKQG